MKYVAGIAVPGTLLPAVLFSVASCVSIPEKPYVMSSRGASAAVAREAACRDGGSLSPAAEKGPSGEGIDPGGFTLLSWNLMKGWREGWREDFRPLAAGADLVTLQEASLTEELHRELVEGRYQWDLTAAFLYRDRETGVLTGARSSPDSLCVTRFSEPLAVIPKTVLVSRYPLAGTGRSLLVANVHLINFTVDTGRYRAQLRELEAAVASHDGPLVVAGDFNTWSGRRMRVIEELMTRLGARPVELDEEGLASFFGRPVDHVYYRGLEVVDARVVPVSTSDHNPVLVSFRALSPAGI